jgi:hypothetical protein
MEQVGFWLGRLKLDVDTPDLWAEVQRERALLAAVSDEAIENTPFTPAEHEEIAEQLQELKNYQTRALSLSEEQVRLLDDSHRYLRRSHEPGAPAGLCKTHSGDASHGHRAHPEGRPSPVGQASGTAGWWLASIPPRALPPS